MNPDPSQPINEVGRLVIHLPDDAMFYRDRSYLPVAVDLVDGMKRATLLASGERGIHYMAQYEVFSALCCDRAQKTVDHSLVVSGAPTTPERYLGMWRAAIAEAVTPAAAAQTYGIHAYAILRAPLDAMEEEKSSWTTCPFGTFAAFQAKYGSQFTVSGERIFTLELNLSLPESARDAYYGASLMRRRFDRESPGWRAAIEIRTARVSLHQAGLFEAMEA